MVTSNYIVPTPEEKGRPTLAAVARLAGVSVPTVSKVIHGRADVSIATRDAVRSALETLGYWRSGDVAAPPSRLCELVLVEIGNPWSGELLAAFQRAASIAGLEVGLALVASNEDLGRWLDKMMAARPYGAVLIFIGVPTEYLERLRSAGVRCVAFQPGFTPPAWVPRVLVDDVGAAYQATDHLLELGHRRIAIISGPPRQPHNERRIRGFRAALEDHGIQPDDGYVRSGVLTRGTGYLHTKALLRLPLRPTAVLAGNDQVALGAYDALHESDLRIPQDISMVGIDDQPEARWLQPPLTTMRHPLEDLASVVIDLLAEEPSSQARTVTLPLSLVIRSSTARPSEGPSTVP